MAEANGVSSEQDSANSGSIHHSYEALKGLSRKAILEFEELQQKYNECYKKYTEEQAKLLKAKADLDKLKEVSSLALSEYENLHYNYEVEQDCRDKAEEFATQMMKENKNLKRKSQLIMEQGGSSFLEVPTDNLQGESEDKTESDKNVYKEQIKELKGVVVSLRKELADTQAKLSSIQEELAGEREGHQSTRRKLFMSDKQFKQLNRVSAMAMEEFSVLQLKFQVEAECRNKAEKYAAEVVREKDALDHLTDSFRKDEGLADALKEIANMHKKFADERAEYEAKIKELSEEIKEATDSEFVEGLREKLHVAHEHIDTLGQQLEDAQQRATKAEEHVSELKQNLEDAKKAATVPPPPPPPAAPPPPPPPPPPHQLIKKFIRIVGSSKKKRSQSESAPSDPLKDAMKEMMDRIKSGNVQLRPVQTPQSGKDNEDADGSAMKELGNILSQNKLRKSTTTGDRSGNLLSPVEESECEWANIKLRKRADGGSGNKGTLPANWDSSNGELNRVVLRKPRSRSEGDLLREDNESSNELKKILQKQKQEADKGEIVG